MDKIKTIQDTICKKTRAKCEEDFSNACDTAAKLISPFIQKMYSIDGVSSGERKEKLLKSIFDFNCSGGVYALNSCGKKVPEEYVTEQTTLATAAFMKSITELQDKVDELQARIDDLEG